MKGFIALFVLIASTASAGTLNDFFAKHPDLGDNLAIHNAISRASSMEAAGLARREGGDEKELMSTKGDQFAVLGLRRVKMYCGYPESAQMSGLSAEECKLVLSKNL
ncbi:hypothetical protein [Cedecea sp. P7760]|uniref:hypothetical protein n=1 Tax=Cedecea sp. P7760 TaxID=2726983 RepID=UPI00159F99DB|nr:hypothetical protein [Cedecea sp. P7760]NWC62905.1 hypothetical protein [Cedecea sp. P7760]